MRHNNRRFSRAKNKEPVYVSVTQKVEKGFFIWEGNFNKTETRKTIYCEDEKTAIEMLRILSLVNKQNLSRWPRLWLETWDGEKVFEVVTV